MKLSKEAQEKMDAIQAIENKYGLTVFGMSLSHLVSVGIENLTGAAVDEGVKQIMAQSEKDRVDGKKPSFITPEAQCEILRCSGELAKYTAFTLFAYIKKYVTTNI